MQTVATSWTAEERDAVRNIAHNLLVSWKKDSLVGNRTFTIGVSLIGGNDVIGINPGAVGGPGIYKYFDESEYVQQMTWERGLNMPLGGVVKAMAEATLSNESEPDTGDSLTLNGSSSYASFTRQTFSGEFTLAFWVKNSSASSTAFVVGDSSTDVKIGFANSKLFTRITSGGSSDNVTVPYTTSDWHHLVFTRDSSNKVDVYVDGGSAQRLFSDVAQSGDFTIAYIGRTNTGQYFLGYVDDFAVWNSKLSALQISNIYTSRSFAQGATIIYGFDGTATDDSGNGLTATLNGGATYSPIVSGEFSVGVLSGRFTPDYMGGNSELFTSILPRRPAIISAGFNYDGIDNVIPQFSGIFDKNPAVNMRDRTVALSMADYIDFFQNRYLDRTLMFTAQRTDQVIETLFSQLGMSTAQYELDYGINIIPFGLFEKKSRFSDVMQELVQAENANLYQDEVGVFRFENRQHWDSSPHTDVQRIITTSQVIDFHMPGDDHIINVVEVKSNVRKKQANQKLYELTGTEIIPASGTLDVFVDFTDDYGALPVLSIDTPVYITSATTSLYATNVSDTGDGITNNASISLKSMSTFATSAKLTFQNTSSTPTFLTQLELWGRPAKVDTVIDERQERQLSTTAYEERPLTIENNYIGSESWAKSYGQMILNDFAFPENLMYMTIRAIPELQLGDLISWQGRYWRVYDIKSTLDASSGFIQELSLLKRDITSYFRIGISTIGGSDQIAP